MTWSITINGHSSAGPDNSDNHYYLIEKFFDRVQEALAEIAEDGRTTVSNAILQTNAGRYDLVMGKEVETSSAGARNSTEE